MVTMLFKSLLVGICAAAPLGPVAFMVMQKTLENGRRDGILTGAGSALADTLYACVGFMALSLISGFIDANAHLIMIVGGAVVLAIGVFMAVRNPFRKMELQEERERKRADRRAAKGRKSRYLSYPAKTFFAALANPAAVAVMMALLAFFQIDSSTVPAWAALPLVFCGEILWWTAFSYVVDRFCRNLPRKVLIIVNLLLGIAVGIFGLVLVVKGIF